MGQDPRCLIGRLSMLVFFLNELSVSEQVLDITEARRRALNLVRVLRRIRLKQRNMAVNSAVSLKNALLDQRYSVSEVLAGNEYTEEWLLLKDIADRHPFAEGLGGQFDPETHGVGYDYYGREAIAMGWADQLGTAVISFTGEVDWSEAHLSVLRYEANANDDIQETEVNIRNFSEAEHVLLHENWLKKTLTNVSDLSVDALWENKSDLFPFLRFLDRTKDDLLALIQEKVAYQHAIARLIAVNEDIAEWVATGVDQGEPVFRHKTAKGEHDQRRDDAQWVDKDGGEYYFGKHQYFDPKRFVGRIHFRVCATEKKAVIAYLGRKLGV